MPDITQIFALLFLMLGPFKIIGPFAKMTQAADPRLTRQLASRAVVFSILAVLSASFLGEFMLAKYSIPVPILSMTAGLVLFLVALQNVLRQFAPLETKHDPVAPTLQMALNPLAFPTIVTPYGIAALIIFMAVSPDVKTKLVIGGMVIGIMGVNLAVMLLTRHMGKILFLFLSILGSVLGIIQVALGLMIVVNQVKTIFALT